MVVEVVLVVVVFEKAVMVVGIVVTVLVVVMTLISRQITNLQTMAEYKSSEIQANA